MNVTTKPPPPPQAATRHWDGGSQWVELTRARDDIDAHLLSGRLNEAGVETHTVPDRRAAGAWLHGGSDPWAPVTVWVRRFQLDAARLVLAEISLEQPEPEEDAVQHPRDVPRWPVVWWIVAVVLGVVLTAIALLQTADMASVCEPGERCRRPFGAPAIP